MKKTFVLKVLPLLVVVSGLVLTVTFAQTSSGKSKQSSTDTIPKKEKKIRDLDEALAELDRGESELGKAMKEIDGEKLEKEIRASLKDLDINMDKMKEGIALAMKEVDMVKIKAEMQKALKKVDAEQIQREVKQALTSIDTDKMKADMEKVKEIDLSKMKLELENIRPQIEKSMKEAHKSIDKARKEITSYKELVNALDKDGWLKKGENYKIEYKNQELTVNGKKLSADVLKKYSEYLEDKENFTLQKEEDDFNIHHN